MVSMKYSQGHCVLFFSYIPVFCTVLEVMINLITVMLELLRVLLADFELSRFNPNLKISQTNKPAWS